MDIWTERLEKRHLPILEHWIGRGGGDMTPNDLPAGPGELCRWYENCTAEPGRLDCLVLVYDTPVGLAGLRRCAGREGVSELYLQLYEVNYNLLRTATYATLLMLDRAFSERGAACAEVRVHARHREYLEALERMGFVRTASDGGVIRAAVDKDRFLSRKYLF